MSLSRVPSCRSYGMTISIIEILELRRTGEHEGSHALQFMKEKSDQCD